MIAIDTNILVYSHRRECAEHKSARRAVRLLAEGVNAWAIPWPCIYEFFGIVTHPKIWKERASTPKQAWDEIDAWIRSPALRVIGETSDFASLLERFLRRPRVRGPIVHDARVAAICVAHGVEKLLTRDRDFSLFPELNVENPLD